MASMNGVLRPCLDCGVLTQATRCEDCTRRADRARGSSTQRGYDRRYRRRRAPLIGQPCAMRRPGCTGIATTANHRPDGSLEPACAHCNFADGGARHGSRS